MDWLGRLGVARWKLIAAGALWIACGPGDLAHESEGESEGSNSGSDEGTTSGSSDESGSDGTDGTDEGDEGGWDIGRPGRDLPAGDCEGGVIDGDVFAYDYEDVVALEGVACIEGDLFLSEQFGEIPDLAPLWALQRVEGLLHVGTPDASVGSLQGLDALSYTGGLLVERAPITDLDGLEGLVEIGELGLEVRSWEVFYGDVDGLAGLTIVGGDAIITDTMNLEGLGALESVAGDLWILLNPGLVDLAGLDALQVVEGRFVLALNEDLASIGGLNEAAVNEVHVVSNPLLSTCEVMTWVDSLPPPEHVFVRGNDIGMCVAPDDCSPMEAMAEGGCEVEAATYWDGQQCQEASGCSCVGPDCVAAELWTFYVIGTHCEDAHEHC